MYKVLFLNEVPLCDEGVPRERPQFLSQDVRYGNWCTLHIDSVGCRNGRESLHADTTKFDGLGSTSDLGTIP